MSISSQLKRLTKDTFFYGIGRTLQKFIAFLLFPIYTRLLTQAELGAQDIISTALIICMSVFMCGLDSGAGRYYFDTQSEEEKKDLLSTWMRFEIGIVIPFTVLLIVFSPAISALLFQDSSMNQYVILGIAALPFAQISTIELVSLRLRFQSKKYSLITNINVLTQALLAILFVVVLRMGVRGALLATLLAYLFQMVAGFLFTRTDFSGVFSKKWLRTMLFYGLPTVPASIATWLISSSNRYFLVHLTSLSEVGQYSVGFRISTLPTFLIASFLTAWPMFAYSLVENEDLAKRTFAQTLLHYLTIGLVISVCLSVFSREVILILATSTYERAAGVVPFLCLAAVASGAAEILGIGYLIAKKSFHLTISSVLGGVLSMLLNILLIPLWGIYGAAIATFFGAGVMVTYNYLIGQRHFRVHYDGIKILGLVVFSLTIIGINFFIDSRAVTYHWGLIPIKIILLTLFFYGLFLTKILTVSSLRQLIGIINNKMRGFDVK